MGKRSIGVFAATIAAAATLVPAASAGQTFETSIYVIDSDELKSGLTVLSGVLESDRPRCQSDRVVKLLVSTNASGPLEVADTGRSSTRGMWAVAGHITKDTVRVRIRATLKRLSRSKTCVAASEPVFF